MPTIDEMLFYLRKNIGLLEPHQQQFILSLDAQFKSRGSLSDKQVMWLGKYYDAIYDPAPDPGDDWQDGHPFDIGDR